MRMMLIAAVAVGCGHVATAPDARMLELCGSGYLTPPWAGEIACEPACAGIQQDGPGGCTIRSQVHGAIQCGVDQNSTAQFTLNGVSGCCGLVDGPNTQVDYWTFYPCQ